MRKLLSLSSALCAAALLTLAVAPASAATLDVPAAKARISADYKVAKAQCDALAANAKDICVEEAKGREKIALAELEYTRTGKAEDHLKIAIAKAEAAYEVAKERCDDKAGNDKDVCRKEAKAAEVRAKADAQVAMAGAEARRDANTDQRNAEYKVAIEKCDALAGDAKHACVDAAKLRYGK